MLHNLNGVDVQMPAEMEAVIVREAAEWNAQKTTRAFEELRRMRNIKLAETDWAALPDRPEMSDAMKTYRQALRDLPATTPDPYDVTWPTQPLK